MKSYYNLINNLTKFSVKPGKSNLFRFQSNKNLVEAFFEICEVLETNQMIEIGAHEASASVRFVRKSGRKAIAIEANPYTFEKLTCKAEKYGVSVLNIGIGDSNGKSILKIPVSGKSLTPANASFLDRVNHVVTHDYEVNLVTLDSVQTNFLSNENTALWIDVEGFGYEVLVGASNYLEYHSPVIFMEVETVKFWKNQKNVNDIVEKLRLHNFIPILSDEEYEKQYNLIFIKENLFRKVETLVSEFEINNKELKVALSDLLTYKLKIIIYRFKRAILIALRTLQSNRNL